MPHPRAAGRRALQPGQRGAVERHAGTAIQAAYIGACTGAKLEDLRFAAQVLRGRQRGAGVRLLVRPPATPTATRALAEGTLQALTDAGAQLLPSACGICAGYGDSFGANETVISSTARNFKGRMGPASTQVYLASAYTVAALGASRAHRRPARGAGMKHRAWKLGADVDTTRWPRAHGCSTEWT
jgi:3-isopropylmalate/(R)-2-methylmalate dehydratase large subunit